MEALVTLIAELIFTPVMAALTAIAQVLASLLSLILELLLGWIGLTPSKAKKKTSSELEDKFSGKRITLPVTRKVLRFITWSLLSLTFVFSVTLVIVNYLFLNDVAKWAMAKIEQRSGIAVSYEKFEGDLLKGNFKFHNLRAKRMDNRNVTFDIKAESVDIDLVALTNPLSEARMNYVRISGVSGEMQRLKKKDKINVRTPFDITQLELHNINLNYKDSSDQDHPLDLVVMINDWNSEPVRSQTVLFDMFFRTNAHGTINNKTFSIETIKLDTGRNTKWRVEDVPVGLLGMIVGGPFKLLESGRVDVNVDDTWQIAEQSDIDFDWTFTFKNINARVPENYTGLSRTLASKAVNYLNARPDKFEFAFGMTMNQKEFTGRSSLAASGLWRTLLSAMTKELSQLTGYEDQEIKSQVRKGFNAVKGFLNKRRKTEKKPVK